MWSFFCSYDASKEPKGGPTYGRLVNHGTRNEVNCKIKIIDFNIKPYLCLFSLKVISPNEEISYDYGETNLPFINKKNI